MHTGFWTKHHLHQEYALFTEHFMVKVIHEIYGSRAPWDSKWHLSVWEEKLFRYMGLPFSSSFCTLWIDFASLCEASILKPILPLTAKKKGNVLGIGDLTQQTNSCEKIGTHSTSAPNSAILKCRQSKNRVLWKLPNFLTENFQQPKRKRNIGIERKW